MSREIRLLDGEGVYSVQSDRAVIPPFGVLGGAGGAPVRVAVAREGDEERPLAVPGKATGRRILAGDLIVMQSAGGGGYGDPLERDARRVAEDVRAGYVSRQAAEGTYGVVLDAAGGVDADATRALRRRRAADRWTLEVQDDETPAYAGIRGRQRRLRIAPAAADAWGLADGDLVEIAGRNAAPLRAWVLRDARVPAGTAPLDAFARRVLGTAAGERITLRRLVTVVRPGERP
jgi:N-methylhydantoinase B